MKNSIPLDKLNFLVLDCQATGPTPETHHLLEIGWTVANLSRPNPNFVLTCFTCKLPEGGKIPAAVTRVTGIEPEDLKSGRSQASIWKKLQRLSKKICQANGTTKCPTIIHFARYEEPFLLHLHQKFSAKKTFPLEIICTHEITKRLLPHLPRKGLRATAGFLGYSVPEWRRSEHHILATEFIWKKVIAMLKESGVTTWEQLKQWSQQPQPKTDTMRIVVDALCIKGSGLRVF